MKIGMATKLIPLVLCICLSADDSSKPSIKQDGFEIWKIRTKYAQGAHNQKETWELRLPLDSVSYLNEAKRIFLNEAKVSNEDIKNWTVTITKDDDLTNHSFWKRDDFNWVVSRNIKTGKWTIGIRQP